MSDITVTLTAEQQQVVRSALVNAQVDYRNWSSEAEVKGDTPKADEWLSRSLEASDLWAVFAKAAGIIK